MTSSSPASLSSCLCVFFFAFIFVRAQTNDMSDACARTDAQATRGASTAREEEGEAAEEEDSAHEDTGGGGVGGGEEREEQEQEQQGAPFCGGVYILANRDNNRTYVGCAGISFFHRLRQHNREIKGGASATAGTHTWYHALLVTGFANRIQALSFEWYVKKYKWFWPGAWDGVKRGDPNARHQRKVELLFKKFGNSKFQGLVLHNVAAHSLTQVSGCACFDCECKGGTIDYHRRIVPTRKSPADV